MAFVAPVTTPIASLHVGSSLFCPQNSRKTARYPLQPSGICPLHIKPPCPLSSPLNQSMCQTYMKITSAARSTKPKILIAGAPASGKGTQCEMIVERYGVVHISAGEMLRAAVKAGTKLGLLAKSYIDEGHLVPDELVISMITERMAQPDCHEMGWLLDGFPRTCAQAKALDDAGIIPSAVIFLEVKRDALVERVVGRRTDPVTGKIYHLAFSPPPTAEISDRLTQRSDDTAEKIAVRLDEYNKCSREIHKHYAPNALQIDGNRSKRDVFAEVVKIIDASLEKEGTKQKVARTTRVAEDEVISTKGMPIPEFVRRAEEAFERGELDPKDIAWSGQATMESQEDDGGASYADIFKRTDLFIGDLLTIIAFAWIGRVSHGSKALDWVVLRTAFPFILSWIVFAPVLGAYRGSSTKDYQTAFQTLLKSWAVCVPIALVLRGVLAGHPPPASFALITLTSTLVLLGSWRSFYVKAHGDDDDTYRKGGLIDGFKMITTLFRRW